MKVIYLPRGKGKTHKLVKMIEKDPNAIIVVPIRNTGLVILSYLEKIDPLYKIIYEDRIFTFQQVKNGCLKGREGNIYIDNGDMLLQSLFPYHKIEIITITKD